LFIDFSLPGWKEENQSAPGGREITNGAKVDFTLIMEI